MSERFFTDQPILGPQAVLAGPEAHHLLHVMRAKVGDVVTLFDGAGAEYQAQIESVRRDLATLAVLSRSAIDREPPTAVTIVMPLPRGDRQKWLVEKLTELGVARLAVVDTQRSVASATPSGLEKLRRGVIEAAKQCGRNRLMEIGHPMPLAEALANFRDCHRSLGHPGASAWRPQQIAFPRAIVLGPEGGLTDAEVQLATDLGWEAVSLGASILRMETAAVAAATLAILASKP